ncbi:inovirus-type Gp2 protein [Salmonella enterica]|nr:inovirus Gp2 family protein [Salmonella enterica subsp. enterica serovar Florida]EID3015417.1 inovirus-type Gp2 protein [Salmonella enterica]
MKPYNANPNYVMNGLLLEDINKHMEAMFHRFAKLLPFRIDFAYRKTSASFGHACKYAMCAEFRHLLAETEKYLAGFYWVMEYTPKKGLHIHFLGYLNGQYHQNPYQLSRTMGEVWKRITEGDGYHHLCRKKDNYPVRIDQVIHYADTTAINALRYAISYLAKSEQKENGIILGRSTVPDKSGRGRPRQDRNG